MDAISKGHFTLRTMRDQLSNLQKLGPVSFDFFFRGRVSLSDAREGKKYSKPFSIKKNTQQKQQMTQLLGMLPGMAQSGMLDQGHDKVTQLKLKGFMTMMDSMTEKVWMFF